MKDREYDVLLSNRVSITHALASLRNVLPGCGGVPDDFDERIVRPAVAIVGRDPEPGMPQEPPAGYAYPRWASRVIEFSGISSTYPTCVLLCFGLPN